jgi:hypothetical protein
MIYHPRTPIVLGGVLILGLAALLAAYSPHPGALSVEHSSIERLSSLEGCVSCHTSRGMSAGCLDCHQEIASQLSGKSGYHHSILSGKEISCSDCHPEHNGAHFPLVSEISWGSQTFRGFKHPHVRFGLAGAHETLLCEACHKEKLEHPFALEDFPAIIRRRTFLGLIEECRACHEDIHSDGLSGACEACHGQDAFRPTVGFDHSKRFPLTGGHERVPCGGCHVLPHPQSPRRPSPFPFDLVRGSGCAECHDSPHLSLPTAACEGCHLPSAPKWSGASHVMSREAHASTGFSLALQHAEVSCDKCHPSHKPFRERYPDPSLPDYRRREDTCEGCHQDAHDGQFRGRHDRCADCHAKETFRPAAFAHAAHAKLYPLKGAHAAAACTACHLMDASSAVRRFAGTSKQCKACHQDAHGGQFDAEIGARDCTACHDEGAESFRLRAFDHAARARYPLEGAHAGAACSACHRDNVLTVEERTAVVTRYRGTPRDCGGCHRDAHRKQFEARPCGDCHASFASWTQVRFDHDAHSRFPLDGAHERAPCSKCHPRVTLADGAAIVQYKPLGRECTDCHDMLRKE